MGFDVSDLFESLFGSGLALSEAVAVPGPDDNDDDGGGGGRFADWVRRPDCHGHMGWEAPDLPEHVPFDSLPEPGPPCPICGSLELWQDGLGRRRCGNCEAETLGRSLRLVKRATQLRKRGQPRKPAVRIAPCCVSGGMSIHKTLMAEDRTEATREPWRDVKLGKSTLRKDATICGCDEDKKGYLTISQLGCRMKSDDTKTDQAE